MKQLGGGPFVRLTLEGASQRPTWSADGRDILYSMPSTSRRVELRRGRADGTGSSELLLRASRDVYEVQMPRDTTRLIVRLGIPPTRDVYLFDRTRGTGDSALTPLVADDRYEEVGIALSPDGRWLAYASNESGRFQVYVRPFPDVNAGRWQISVNGGNEPHWAHSGRELFFRDEKGNLVAMAVTTSPGFAPGGAARSVFRPGVHDQLRLCRLRRGSRRSALRLHPPHGLRQRGRYHGGPGAALDGQPPGAIADEPMNGTPDRGGDASLDCDRTGCRGAGVGGAWPARRRRPIARSEVRRPIPRRPTLPPLATALADRYRIERERGQVAWPPCTWPGSQA